MLKNFTVSALCSHTGLRPAQVYHELAHLKRDGYITSEPIHVSSSTVRPPHRPHCDYRLTDDHKKIYAMAEGMPLRVVDQAEKASLRAAPPSSGRLVDLFEPTSVLRQLYSELSLAAHPAAVGGTDLHWLQNILALDDHSWDKALSQLIAEPGIASSEGIAQWLSSSISEVRMCLKSQLLSASALLFRRVIEIAAAWAANPQFVAEWVTNNFLSKTSAEAEAKGNAEVHQGKRQRKVKLQLATRHGDEAKEAVRS